MHKSNVTIHRFRCRNRFSDEAGALIRIQSDDLPLEAQGVWLWLQSLPSIFRITEPELQGSLFDVLAPLLTALTDQARLDLHASARVIKRSDDAVLFWLPLDVPRAADVAVELALHGLSEASSNPPDPKRSLQLWLRLKSLSWNQTHRHVALAAQKLGVPVMPVNVGGISFLQLGQGARSRLLLETITDRTTLFAQQCSNKAALHQLLPLRGVPLPVQRAVKTEEEALAAAIDLGWPVVLKPANSGKGRGVWVGLMDSEALLKAWQNNVESGLAGLHLIQQVLKGHDHRMLVVNGTLLATAQRRPAELRANGIHCVGDQIRALNQDPERGKDYERLFNQVKFDARLDALLESQSLSLSSIPAEGTKVLLSRAANLSEGGYSIDCSEIVHSDNRRLAEDVACLLGADVIGLDVMSDDLAVSWREGNTYLLEANLSPGLRVHLAADPGTDLCERLVHIWCGSDLSKTKIPVALVTGSIGKTTTCRMLAHILSTSGLRVGLTSSTGMELDGCVLSKGDLAGGEPALHLLSDRRLEGLVVEVARGGILKNGLSIDKSDAAAVLNVLDNHIGIDGIGSREDLARIKAVVAESAESILALNADDPLVLAMGQHRDPAMLVLVSELPGSSAWHSHRRNGNVAVSYSKGRAGSIKLFAQNRELLDLNLKSIPASDDGCIGPIAFAAAFSAGMAYGMDQTPELIVKGLQSFGLQTCHLRGRFETLMRHPWQLVLTWADGPEAMASVSGYAQAATTDKPRRRLLLCSAPDNRPDTFLRQVGEATWGFDVVITASWEIRRGRHPGEVPSLIAQGARSLGSGGPEVLISGTESDAIKVLAQKIRPGDFCVVMCFDSERIRKQLHEVLEG